MKYSLTLQEIINETPDVKSFIFTSDKSINYQAGQFLKWRLSHDNPDNRGMQRYFTIASAPFEKFILLTTKFAEKSSSFKTALQNLQLGEEIEVDGPRGDFVFTRGDDEERSLDTPAVSQTNEEGSRDTESAGPRASIVFIAGGIGITPFRAILKDLDSKNLNPKITLIYGNRDANFPFKALFDELAAKHSNLKIDYIVGPITKETLHPYLLPPTAYRLIYISGPEPMVESLGQTLVELGILKDNIKQDFFPGYTE